MLESIQSRSNDIVYTLVPEKHRHTDDNKINTFKVPLDLINDTEDISKMYVADSQKGTLNEVRLHYPATVKTVASGYTNRIAVAMVHGIVIFAERTGDLYCLALHSKLQVKPPSMKKAEMEAFVARHKVKVVQENAKNRIREELKSAINHFLQNNKKKVTSKGTKLDLEPSVKTPVAMTSLADEILFLADTETKRLLEVRVEKADFKLDCYLRTVMNFKDNINPTGLCIIEGQQKLLLADSGTDWGLLVVNLEDGTTLQLLQNGSPECCQIHGVCLCGQSVIFTDTKSHTLKRFSVEAALLDGTNKIQKVDRRPRAAFSSPRSQFFTIRTDPKPDNNMFIFFSCGKLAYNWVCLVRNFVVKIFNERTSIYYTKKHVLKNSFFFELLYVSYI